MKRSFSLAMTVLGTLMLLIGIGITFASPDWMMELKIAPNAVILAGMQAMFVIGGVILLFLGLVILATGRLTLKAK